MIVNTKYFFNDTFSPNYFNSSNSDQLTFSKFNYLSNTSNPGYLDLELWYLRINNKVIKRQEYGVIGTTLSPLTSLRVGNTGGGEVVTLALPPFASPVNPPISQLGFTNYTNFINRIFNRHGISSRFFPMGRDYTPAVTNFDSITKNLIGCKLSILEDFALTFVEKATDIPLYDTQTVIHIETTSPMSLRAQMRDFNTIFDFNSLTSPFNTIQFILDYTNFFTEKRYTINI